MGIGRHAPSAPSGLENILARGHDQSHNVRLAAVQALGTYANSGDKRVTQALEKALDDTKHKVRHTAARILAVPCPGCGRRW